MWRVIRRLLVVVIFGAATMMAFRAVRAQRALDAGPEPDAEAWPPLEEGAPAPLVSPGSTASPAPSEPRAWCEPTGPDCPDGFPIKTSSSGIYHVPGGQFYDRTVPSRCYATAAAAEADGYRAAKR